jgi:AraC family transcriptional regulator
MPVAQAKRSYSDLRHRAQVAKARRYLNAHATGPVRLGAVARAAGSSRFHLSRVYRALTGETVIDAVARIRIERAAAELCAHPRRPISQVALDVGYQTPSAFNKAFRAALRVSPSEFRAAAPAERRARVRALQAAGMAGLAAPDGALAVSRQPAVRWRDAQRVIFVREHGSYPDIAAPLAWAKLERALPGVWLARRPRIAAAYDDPETVDAEALRYDAGVIVGDDAPVPPGTAAAIWPGGWYAVFEYRGPYRLIGAAFAATFTRWVAQARPRLRIAPCLEVYRSPASTPEAERLTELWLPIEGPVAP